MEYIKLFELFIADDYAGTELDANLDLKDSIYLLSSKGGVYLFSMDSYDSWLSFLESNKWLNKELSWAINPSISSSAEVYFNLYLKRFPIFCVIIDVNNNQIYGTSLDHKGEVGMCVDQNSNPLEIEKFFNYLEQLGLSLEDL